MRKIFLLFTILSIVSACDISDNEVEPTLSFLKIFDNNDFNASFIPIDVKQTADGGYLILASTRVEDSNFTGVYLMKVDESGEFVSEQRLPTEFLFPVDNLLEVDGTFYFIAMRDISFEAVIFAVNDAGELSEPIGLGVTRPLTTALDGSDILLLSYDNSNKNTVFSVYSTAGGGIGFLGSKSFSIGTGEGIDAPITNHFTRTGRQLPFQIGRVSNNGPYFFNGFVNFTISLIFTDLVSDDPLGVSQGQQDDGGLSAVRHLSGSTFAVSRFDEGDNYLLPNVDINMGSITSSVDLGGNPFPELVEEAPVIVKRMEINGQQVLLYGSNTRSGQIILLAYDADTGILMGTKYLGFSNPYQISGFTPTDDAGLAVVGNTSVAGRFDRLCLFKLSEQELIDFIN